MPQGSPPEFDAAFRARLHELFCWRRDVRRFRRDALSVGVLERLIGIACTAPSVGLSQPWRFVIVDDVARQRGLTCPTPPPSMRRFATSFASW
jgi:5,6-dimethylbenzimidazole synthase